VELVDSHCHLDDKQFDPDRVAVLERARSAGLKYLLAIGTGEGPPDLSAGVRLAELHSFIHATVGVHPNDAEKATPETFRHLEVLLQHHKVKAMGEIGLDYHWGVPKEVQLSVFRQQMRIAAEAHLPIVIHTRDAWDDTLDELKAHWAPSGLGCLMHCFTGTAKQAEECIDLGFSLAFGGVTTFPKSISVQDAARLVPANRILLETDSPYLAPVPYRGKRNEPAYVAQTAKVIARLRGVSTEELATQTTRNFERIFGIGAPQA
jgi:TatD DNase family protein